MKEATYSRLSRSRVVLSDVSRPSSVAIDSFPPLRSLPGFDQLLSSKRDRLARFHFVKIDLEPFEFVGKTISGLRDAGESSEVLRNGQLRAHRLRGFRRHLWLHS